MGGECRMGNIQILAHRGLSANAPENTIVSFRKALEANADGIEFDVQITKDKKLVVIHDEKVDRTTNGHGFVRDYTYGELKLLDAGGWFSEEYSSQRIPSLIEVLELVKDSDSVIHIELKNSFIGHKEMAQKVLEVIEQYNLQSRVVISSFNHQAVKTFNELGCNIETAILFEGVLSNPIEYLKEIGAKSIHTSINSLNPSLLDILKKNNIKVRCYTINSPEDFLYLKGIGIDAVFTDMADIIMKLKNS